tara:strand:- start:10382 stop:11014 length:633 start_codon:yes stop_codon:yes gene_type:complete
MAVATVTQKQLLDNYACLTLLEFPTGLSIGDTFTVTNVGAPFNGNSFIVYAMPEYLFMGVNLEGEIVVDPLAPIANQVLYAVTGSNVERVASVGSLTFNITCTWITGGDVQDFIGIGAASAIDEAFFTVVANASNSFCYRRRSEAGYVDSPTVVPNDAVKLGVTSYASFLYRQRGAVTDFASFDGMVSGSSSGLNAMVKQLLGIDRPRVA